MLMMRKYHSEEISRMEELEGLPLADFWQRAGAFATDAALAVVAVTLVLLLGALAKWALETGADLKQHRVYHFSLENEWAKIVFELVVPVLYFGLTTFRWNGRTVGKRLFGIRVVSLVHARMSLWHSIERPWAMARRRWSSASSSFSSTRAGGPRRIACAIRPITGCVAARTAAPQWQHRAHLRYRHWA
jgi:uncharacterized RDD family membrane protein YckC